MPTQSGGIVTRGRIILYGGTICAFYVLVILSLTALSDAPARIDYIAFHTAGRMALAGDAAAAYVWERMLPLQAETLGVPAESLMFLGWVNPPHFFFAILPFSFLPYGWGWFAWVMATAALLALSIRAVMPDAPLPAAIAVFCTPAVLTCAGVGQNGMLTAALMAWTHALMDRRPVAAGIALGLLTYKPQFGLLIPLLLVATGRWRVAVSASVTALVAMAAAVLAFGPETFTGFLANVGLNNDRYLADPSAGMARIQSVYALVFQAGRNRTLAWAAHLVFAAGVAAIVLRLWVRRPEGPQEARAAAAIAAAFLMTPFTWVYDAPSIAIAALFLVRAGLRDGFMPWERTLIVLACVITQIVSFTGPHSAIVPAAWLVILALAWRRDRAWRLSPAPSAKPS